MAIRPPKRKRSSGKASTAITRPPKQSSDLMQRVVVAVPAVVALLFLIHFGGELFAFGALAVGLLAIHEFFRMVERSNPIKLGGFLAVIGMSIAALYGDPYYVLLAFAASLPLIYIVLLIAPRVASATESISVTVLAVAWIGLPIAHIIMLRELPHGGGVIVAVLAGTFIGDTGAYLGGKMFGKHKLAPSISPNKTVEGLVAGILSAVLAVWFTGLYQDWIGGFEALLLGLGVAAVAPLGDLFESLLKRDVGVKDSGRAFGAHGGALDRIDAVLFSAVAGFYIWTAML